MTWTHPGLLVSLDGLAGAGKTTTAKRLRTYLSARGYKVYVTTQPSSATLGEIARHNTATYHGLALACLVAADRYHHIETELRPNTAAAVCDLCRRVVITGVAIA